MKIAAYCRVSTDKADQLYTQRTGDVLVKLYADEGVSGTKIKNRKKFLRMIPLSRLKILQMFMR